jgi:hypothetical protein
MAKQKWHLDEPRRYRSSFVDHVNEKWATSFHQNREYNQCALLIIVRLVEHNVV